MRCHDIQPKKSAATNPSNQPTLVTDNAGGSEPGSFEELAKSLSNHPEAVAAAVLGVHCAADWKEVSEIGTEATGKEEGMVAQQCACLGSWSDSLEPMWFFFVCGLRASR